MNGVRGAMERYRAHVAGVNAMIHPRELPYTYIDETTGAGGMVQEAWERDAHRLALAYLAEHAADDDEPVTEEWLWSVGFTPDVLLPQQVLVAKNDDMKMEHWTYPDAEPDVSVDGFIPVTTRGSVRRLAAALGIQLKGEQ